MSSCLLVLILILSFPMSAIGNDTEPRQQETEVTVPELLKMLNSNHARALEYIGRVYSKHLNSGVVPETSTLRILAIIVRKHIFLPGRSLKWDVPAEGWVIEVLKDIPRQLESQRILLEEAYKAAEGYFSQPSYANAKKLLKALPEQREFTLDFEGMQRLQNLIFDFIGRKLRVSDPPDRGLRKNFSILEKGVAQGDPLAVDIMFRLLNISDGAITETICFVLGQSIPNHSRLFLQKALAYGAVEEPRAMSRIEWILVMVTQWGEIPEAGNSPEKFKEIYDSRLVERIKALESVDDPDLLDIRNRCLAILKKNLY